MRAHERMLERLEETFAQLSRRLAARRGEAGGREADVRDRLDALRRQLGAARDDPGTLARVRATLDDLRRDYDAALPHTALHHVEAEAFRRHLHTTAGLLRDLSNLDSPRWDQAHEEYERSWAEVERAFESESGSLPA